MCEFLSIIIYPPRFLTSSFDILASTQLRPEVSLQEMLPRETLPQEMLGTLSIHAQVVSNLLLMNKLMSDLIRTFGLMSGHEGGHSSLA